MEEAYCIACGGVVQVRGRRCLAGHLVEHDAPQRPTRLVRVRHAPEEGEYRSTVLEMLGFSTVFENRVPPPANAPIRLAGTRRLPERPATPAADGDEPESNEPPGLVKRLWDAGERHGEAVVLGEDWVPGLVPGETARDFRKLRWWPILLLVALVVGATVLVQTLRSAPERTAQAVRVNYVTAAQQLRATLVAVSGSNVALTDPAVAGDALADATIALNTFQARAAEVARLADEPLPTPPPFGPTGPIEALNPYRQRLVFASDLASAVDDKLSATYTYRALFEDSFLLPDLPDAVAPEALADIRVQLAAAVNSTQDAVDQLPDEDLLSSHRRRTIQAAARLDDWQTEYVDALRRSDAVEVASLKGEISEMISSLRGSLPEPLLAVRTAVQADLVSLDTALEKMVGDLVPPSTS